MCLTIRKSFATEQEAQAVLKKPNIAKEDIKVYKALDCFNGVYQTPYRGYTMKEGEHYYQTGKIFGTSITKRWGTARLEINITQGLHAWLKRKSAVGAANNIIEMIIPKGSKYFIGMYGDIVSDNLIWPWSTKK